MRKCGWVDLSCPLWRGRWFRSARGSPLRNGPQVFEAVGDGRILSLGRPWLWLASVDPETWNLQGKCLTKAIAQPHSKYTPFNFLAQNGYLIILFFIFIMQSCHQALCLSESSYLTASKNSHTLNRNSSGKAKIRESNSYLLYWLFRKLCRKGKVQQKCPVILHKGVSTHWSHCRY